MNLRNKDIFTYKPTVIILAIITAVTWAFAFPLIKIGFELFQIDNSDTGAKTLFAGVRFFIAGILTFIISKFSKCNYSLSGVKCINLLVWLSLINTTFHYFFFYIGLSNLSGSRSSIIDSLSTFILIILACIVFKDEHLTKKKIIGCLFGFLGIFLININFDANSTSAFTLQGDGMLFMSSLCSAMGGILTRIVTKTVNPLVATAISLTFGGLLLIILGICMGGKITEINLSGLFILLLLALVSTVGFSLYNKLISCNPVGEIAIFNSFIPIFGTILSCIILKEEFYFRYFLAGILVIIGVFIINKTSKNNSPNLTKQ